MTKAGLPFSYFKFTKAYDPVSRKAWSQSKITANGLNVEALMMTQITQLGATNFGSYQTAVQFEEWFPLFMEIGTSVTPDPEIAYRPDSLWHRRQKK